MYYSIYPRLRAIFTYLPEEEDYRDLGNTETLDEFENRLQHLKLLDRFPREGMEVDKYLKLGCFPLEKDIQNRLDGKGARFFKDFMKIYELKDITNAIHNRKGRYFLFQEGIDSLEEIGETLQGTIWSKPWQYGFDRYEDSGDKFEIQITLEPFYYTNLLQSAHKLGWDDRGSVVSLVEDWVNNVNRKWIYRLGNKYNKEKYEMKQYLIPDTETYENLEEISGLDKSEFEQEVYPRFYNTFKNKMYTMAAILSFFMIFRRKMENLYSIYTSKKYRIDLEKISSIIGVR